MGKIEKALGLPAGTWDIPIASLDVDDSSDRVRRMRAVLLMQVSQLPEAEIEKAAQTLEFVLGLGKPKTSDTES